MPISFDWSQTITELSSPPIPPQWLATQGSDVKVAFIDTGANLGLASLRHLEKAGHKFFTGGPNFSVAKLAGQDLVGEAFGIAGQGHGSLYASLLAGKSPNPAPTDKDLVIGIANAATIYIIKATDTTGEITTIKHLLDGLELCGNLGVEIVITGQCISRSEMQFEHLTVADINRVFDIPEVNRMFVFAPLKNRKTAAAWTGLTTDNFPSHHPAVYNVAKLPEIFPLISDVIKAQKIPFLLSGFKGQVLSKTGDAIELSDADSHEIEFSNSGAVTIMGGLATLALSSFKQQNGGVLPGREQFTQMLGDICRPIDDAFGSFEQPAIFKNF